MNSSVKYTSLANYAVKLNGSILSFDAVFLVKPPKQLGSLKVTLKNLSTTVDNLVEIQRMQSEIKKFARLDSKALKDNRSARKAVDQIDSIETDLNQNYSRLKDEFFKQMEVAGKQCREVKNAIKDKEQRESFSNASHDFELMAFEANTEKHKIPFNEKDNLSQLKQDTAEREHQEKEELIDNNLEVELDAIDKLKEALNTLTKILITVPNDNLANEVRSEVAQIKKALPPKTIAITKNGLETLRHSSHLILDLEQISEIMKTTYGFLGKDGKLQKIDKKLETLKPLLEQAIKEEKARNAEIKQETDVVQGKVDYATAAVKTYSNILDNNAKLEEVQKQIRDETHAYYAENERLENAAKKADAEAHEILMKPERDREWNDELKIDQLYDKAKEDRQTIKDNEKYMADKMYERPVEALPLKYTNMKKRLQSMSSLYQMQIIQEQELSSGGMSK